MNESEEAVRRGVTLLDARGPEGWRGQLRGATLDVEDPYLCPIGQLYGTYWLGLNQLGLTGRSDAREHGFHCTQDEPHDRCDGQELSEIWRRVLAEELVGAG